jgi:hypothetical protein
MTSPHSPATRHPYALTLALLIGAEAQQRHYSDGTFEHAVHEVIERAFDLAKWSNERKADLYARLAESLTAADTNTIRERKINEALWAAERDFNR